MVHLDLLTRLRQELRFTLATIEEGTLAVAERVNRKVQLMRLHWQASQAQAALSRMNLALRRMRSTRTCTGPPMPSTACVCRQRSPMRIVG